MPQPSLHAHVYELSSAVHAEPVSPLLAHGFGGGVEAPGTTPHVSGSWMHVGAYGDDPSVLQPSLHAQRYELSSAVHTASESPRLSHGLGSRSSTGMFSVTPGITPHVSEPVSKSHKCSSGCSAHAGSVVAIASQPASCRALNALSKISSSALCMLMPPKLAGPQLLQSPVPAASASHRGAQVSTSTAQVPAAGA